ncbi:MAG: GNAT family N-acetyltransferase [Phyllobacterium sp.]|nr:GNAT family N-acetyltransferase [Phyllobacterium sp.]ODT13095.1 MAG: hypothetical protein ABS57_19855 [Mesorhizobium sp. SCN 65-12]
MTIRYMNVPLAPDWKKIAEAFFTRMIAEKAIDADRAKLTGFEWGVFALEGTGRRSKPVGMSIYYQPEGHSLVWLDLLYVAPAHRGFGIGTSLIERTAAAAETWGVSRLEFGTLRHNARMLALAEKCGFAQTAIQFGRDVPSCAKASEGLPA